MRYELSIARERSQKSSDLAEKHQKAVAKLTADNVVQLLRLNQCQEKLTAATQERDSLQEQIAEKRGPWFDAVSNYSLRFSQPETSVKTVVLCKSMKALLWLT